MRDDATPARSAKTRSRVQPSLSCSSVHGRFSSAARPRTTCGEATPSVTRVAPEGTDDASQIRLPGRPHQRRGTDSSQRPSVVAPGACFGREASSQLLATVSFADVAAEVFGALQTLDLDDLDAGPRPGGYVEPSGALSRGASQLRTARICRGQPIGTCPQRWRSAAADAASGHSHTSSSRNTRPTGHGSFADQKLPRLHSERRILTATERMSQVQFTFRDAVRRRRSGIRLCGSPWGASRLPCAALRRFAALTRPARSQS